MKQRKWRWLSGIAALVCANTALAQDSSAPQQKLSLHDAITLALRQQPSLTAADAQAKAARQAVVQTRSAFYPSLSLNYSTNDTYQSNALGTATTNGSSTTRSGDVVLSFQVLDAGQRLANTQSAQASFRASTYAREVERQSAIADTASQYFTLLEQRALVDVQKANVARTQTTLELTKAQAEKGVLPRKDVYQAQADYENAKVSLLSSQNSEAVALAQFKQTLGISGEASFDLTDGPGDGNVTTELSPLTSLLQVAYSERPEIQEAVQSIERDKAKVRYARAANGLTVQVDTNLSAAFEPRGNETRAVALTASLPLFNAGANKAAISQAAETQRSTEAQLVVKRLSVAVEVETAYRNLQIAHASVPAAKTAQEAAQVNYDAAIESRKEGIGTVVDVITAQSQLVEAQTNYIKALFDLKIADVSLQRAIGNADAILKASEVRA